MNKNVHTLIWNRIWIFHHQQSTFRLSFTSGSTRVLIGHAFEQKSPLNSANWIDIDCFLSVSFIAYGWLHSGGLYNLVVKISNDFSYCVLCVSLRERGISSLSYPVVHLCDLNCYGEETFNKCHRKWWFQFISINMFVCRLHRSFAYVTKIRVQN